MSSDRERSGRRDLSPEAGPTFPGRIIAALLEITERRLQQLVVDGWIPRAARGEYSLRDSVRGYIRSLKASAKRSPLPPASVAHGAREAARAALAIVAGVEARCMAADGPVTPTHEAVSADEFKALVRHVQRVQQLLERAQ